mmetsp:Transcript_7733/g.22725  ORF Transcript_7733/g.22725 Transcript_7733/m.22725 type:complete len:239 (+) Transcript_7733:289-1005(+)
MNLKPTFLSEDFAGGGLEKLALAPLPLNGLPRPLGEGVRLNGQILRDEILSAHHHLVNAQLGLGDGSGLEERIEIHGGTGRGGVELVRLDDVVDGLGMPGSHGTSDVLGKATVEGLLPPLESGAGGTAGPGLLSPHAKAAGRALAGGDAAPLAVLAAAGAGGGAEVVDGEFGSVDVVEGGFVGRAALPVVDLHVGGGAVGDGDGGAGGEGRVGGRRGGRGDEEGEGPNDHGWEQEDAR